MPHIHTSNGAHDFVVDGLMLKKKSDGKYKVLLHKHKKYGTYQSAGGHVEVDESVWSALIHEILEESGYSVEQFEVMQPKNRIKEVSKPSVLAPQPVFINTHKTSEDSKHFHIQLLFLLVTSQEPAAGVASGESDDFIEVDKQEVHSLVKEGTVAWYIGDCIDYVYDYILNNWEAVPASSFETESE